MSSAGWLPGLVSAVPRCSWHPLSALCWTRPFLNPSKQEQKTPGPSSAHVCSAHCSDPGCDPQVSNEVLVAHPCCHLPSSNCLTMCWPGYAGGVSPAQPRKGLLSDQDRVPESLPTPCYRPEHLSPSLPSVQCFPLWLEPRYPDSPSSFF